MINVINKDIFESGAKIIVHQVNCQGVMRSGIAKTIKENFPEVFLDYKIYCYNFKPRDLLGDVRFTKTNINDNICCFANLFGQLNYGKNACFTDYIAFETGLTKIKKKAEKFNLSVAIPYKIGCVHGGGNWEKVLLIIEKVFKDYDNVTLYKL